MSVLEKAKILAALPPIPEREAIRRTAGLSSADIAAELGVAYQTVRRWEQGRTAPRGDLAARYGRLLTALREITEGTSV